MSKKEAKTNAMRILERMKIAYTPYTYECEEFHSGVETAKLLGENPDVVYKTLVTKGKGGYFVFVIPIEKELDLKACAKCAGQKSLSMIHVKDINSVTGYIRGGCTAVGMKKAYPTFIDVSAESHSKIIVSGGRLGLQIELSPYDLAKACSGTFAKITY